MEKCLLRRDGSHWMATAPGFEDLQQSSAGFGLTHADAIYDLRVEMAKYGHDSDFPEDQEFEVLDSDTSSEK